MLWEHFSTSPRTAVFRLQQYLIAIAEAERRRRPRSGAMPVVLPIILYHGARRWSAPRRLSDLFELPEGMKQVLRPWLPELRYVLIDLSRRTVDDVVKRIDQDEPAAGVTAAFLKLAPRGDFPRHLPLIERPLNRMRNSPKDRPCLEQLLEYLALVTKAPHEEIVNAMSTNVSSQLGKMTRTPFQKLLQITGKKARAEGRAEGRTRGRAEGEAKGQERGQLAAKREVLLKLLRVRFQRLPAKVAVRIRAADLATLDAWIDRAITARALTDIFQASAR